MKIFQYNVLFSFLFLSLIVLTPFLSLGESLALIFGGITSNSEAITPPFIKGLKDIGFLLFALIFTVRSFSLPYIKSVYANFLFLILLTVILAFGLSANFLVFGIGLRWLLPLLLPVFFHPFLSFTLLRKTSFLLNRLLIIQLLFQLSQMFFGSVWFGANSFGLASRNPGFFFIPSTAGIFAVCVFLFHIFTRPRLDFPLTFLVSISIFLTVSGTAIITFLLALFLCLLRINYLLSYRF